MTVSPPDGAPDVRATLAEDLSAVSVASALLRGTLAGASESDLAEPSLLPGWTRAHVAAHVAGNAEGMLRLVRWALSGTPEPMYDSPAAREEGIRSLAALDADDLRTRVAVSADALAESFGRLLDAGDAALHRLVYFGAQAPVGGPDTPAWATAYARLREVEIHHVDLGLAYAPADWPPAFVERTSAWLDRRTTGPDVVGDPAEVLAWRLGRGAGPTVRAADGGPAGDPPPW